LSLFIVFEGGEGCGKSWQAKTLFTKLSQLGLPAILVHEPGGTSLGKKLRRLLKGEVMEPQAELLLFAAARSQLISEVILPTLKQGTIVIADRYTPSTLAYQGYGRGIDKGIIETINDLVTQGIKPDLVILLDIPADEGLSRKRSSHKDRFESEELPFHQRVRQGYLEMAKSQPQNWLIIDGKLPKEQIAQIIWSRVNSLLSKE
jgi:dTMP kinase